MSIAGDTYCRLLQTKTGYFRSPAGARLIKPESSTACYTCLLTQRPYGPDGWPVAPQSCDPTRECYRRDE